MADNTRYKTNMERLEEVITKLTSNQITLTDNQTQMATKIDEILAKIAQLEPPVSPTTSSTSSHNSFPNKPHHMKLDVPRFDGIDSMGWIFKIAQFFEYHDTPESECLAVASFNMEGPALGWFQWMAGNGQLLSWQSLLHALEAWLTPSQYDDSKGTLFKLTQKGFVNDCLSEFETLANLIVGLASSFLLSCFISDLAPEIRREVLALQPMTFVQAAALARLQEEKFNDNRHSY